jgi:hypothetical protein
MKCLMEAVKVHSQGCSKLCIPHRPTYSLSRSRERDSVKNYIELHGNIEPHLDMYL